MHVLFWIGGVAVAIWIFIMLVRRWLRKRTDEQPLRITDRDEGLERIHCAEMYPCAASSRRTRRLDDETTDDGSPTGAAIGAALLGGDPLIAGAATAFTGDTGVGVVAGVLLDDDETKEEAEEQEEEDGDDGDGDSGD